MFSDTFVSCMPKLVQKLTHFYSSEGVSKLYIFPKPVDRKLEEDLLIWQLSGSLARGSISTIFEKTHKDWKECSAAAVHFAPKIRKKNQEPSFYAFNGRTLHIDYKFVMSIAVKRRCNSHSFK